jgi:hypothetical protein
MFPIRLFSSLRVRPSWQFATANARRSHTVLVAGLALCAAILAMPPVYAEGGGSSSRASADDVSTGRWEIDKLPSYGKISMGTITGTLKKSPCPGVKFTSGAIFYTWTKPTKAKQDGFQATYFGYVNPVHVTWTLKLK